MVEPMEPRDYTNAVALASNPPSKGEALGVHQAPPVVGSGVNDLSSSQPGSLPEPDEARHNCFYGGCDKSFKRLTDLHRHVKKHGSPKYHCMVPGCKFRDGKGFVRSDKLKSHQVNKHGYGTRVVPFAIDAGSEESRLTRGIKVFGRRFKVQPVRNDFFLDEWNTEEHRRMEAYSKAEAEHA
ncbi:MAG: hypothetical protein MMC23_006544 [Stictis urceolatum]|nr:hypothetical protein [Stictis urceolata]